MNPEARSDQTPFGNSATISKRQLLIFHNRDFDRHGPAGPSGFWKVLDGREAEVDAQNHWTNMDDEPYVSPAHSYPTGDELLALSAIDDTEFFQN